MEDSCLLQKGQAEFPGDGAVTTESDQGTRLDPWDTVDDVTGRLVRHLFDRWGRGRPPIVLGGGDCGTSSRLLTLQNWHGSQSTSSAKTALIGKKLGCWFYGF